MKTDVSKIKDLEKRIKKVEAQNAKLKRDLDEISSTYNSLLDNEHLSFLLLDKNQKIVAFNTLSAEYAKITFNKEQKIGQSFLEFVAKPEIEEFKDTFNKILNGETFQQIRSFAAANGHMHEYLIQYLPIRNFENKIDKVCLLGQDITQWNIEKKETAAKVLENISLHKQKKQLQQINDEKTRFITLLAHDLRSPFNSMLGFLDILYNKLSESQDPEIKEEIKYVYSSAKNILALLDNLLSWSQQEIGLMPIEIKKVSISELVNDLLPTLQITASIKNITIKSAIKRKLEMDTDANSLKIVLRNLISNSIKFSNPNKTISIRASETETHVLLSVMDKGVGIENEKLNHLLTNQSTTSTTGTANEKGSGLGLKLCQSMLIPLGGSLFASSEVGKGSTFTVVLPKNR